MLGCMLLGIGHSSLTTIALASGERSAERVLVLAAEVTVSSYLPRKARVLNLPSLSVLPVRSVHHCLRSKSIVAWPFGLAVPSARNKALEFLRASGSQMAQKLTSTILGWLKKTVSRSRV